MTTDQYIGIYNGFIIDSSSFSFFNLSPNSFSSFSDNYSVESFVPGTYGGFGTNSVAETLMISEVAGVPEPATWGLMIAGLAMLGGMLRIGRRRSDEMIPA